MRLYYDGIIILVLWTCIACARLGAAGNGEQETYSKETSIMSHAQMPSISLSKMSQSTSVIPQHGLQISSSCFSSCTNSTNPTLAFSTPHHSTGAPTESCNSSAPSPSSTLPDTISLPLSSSLIFSLATRSSSSFFSQSSNGILDALHSITGPSSPPNPQSTPWSSSVTATKSSLTSESDSQRNDAGDSSISLPSSDFNIISGSAHSSVRASVNLEISNQGSLPFSLTHHSVGYEPGATATGVSSFPNGHNESNSTNHDTDDYALKTNQRSPSTKIIAPEGAHAPANPTQKSYPAFLLPTGHPISQTHGCNVYGPLCQTGLTVVGVNKSSTITTTTVPCSSYLSAQAQSIRAEKSALSSWRAHFGRSPECTSFAEGKVSMGANHIPHWLSSCGNHATAIPSSNIFPPGLFEPYGLNETVHCCGECKIYVPRVELRYFPEDSDIPCSVNIDSATSATITAAPDAQKAHASLFVSDGFTYTSPSLYFAIVGTASFSDDCGQLGTKVVSSTLAIPSGAMSTVSFDVPVGAPLPTGARASELRHLARLKTRDLACPTWGVNMPVPSKPPQDVQLQWPKIEWPFYPLLVPPRQLLSVDHAWHKCVDNHWPLRFGIFDPPRALTSNSVMLGSPTSVPTPQPNSDPVLISPSTTLQLQPAQAPAQGFPQATSTVASTTAQPLAAFLPVEQASGLPNTQDPDDSNANSGSSSGQGDVGSGGNQDWGAESSSPDDPPSDGYTGSDTSPSGESSFQEPGSSSYGSSSDTSGTGESGSDSDSAELPSRPEGLGGTAYPILTAAFAITIGDATYTQAPSCSCYNLPQSQVLRLGNSVTMPNGEVVALASNGASAVVGGSTQQLSPVVTGVAPAFAGVLNAGQGMGSSSWSSSGSGSRSGVEEEAEITGQSPKAVATFSVHGYALTAAPASGTSNLFLLKGSGGAFTTLTPGGAAFTVMGNEVISLGTDGVLKIDGSAVATTPTWPSATFGGIGAAVATAFSMGQTGSSTSEPSSGGDESSTVSALTETGVSPSTGSQARAHTCWLRILMICWGGVALLIA